MINHIRYIWQSLVLTSLLLILGILLIPSLRFDISLTHFIVSLCAVLAINSVAWFVMVRGIDKGNRDGMVVLFVGIGLKFLLYLFYILLFWLITKNLTKPFIITFFTLYLLFTLLLALHLFKVLKDK